MGGGGFHHIHTLCVCVCVCVCAGAFNLSVPNVYRTCRHAHKDLHTRWACVCNPSWSPLTHIFCPTRRSEMQTSSAERKAKRASVDEDVLNYVYTTAYESHYRRGFLESYTHIYIHALYTQGGNYYLPHLSFPRTACFSACVSIHIVQMLRAPLLYSLWCDVECDIKYIQCPRGLPSLVVRVVRDLCDVRITWILRHSEREQHNTT